MPSRQRYVILAVLTLAGILAVVFCHGLEWTWTQAGWADPALLGVRELSLTHGLGVGLAMAGAALVLTRPTSRTLAGEVVEELARVSWPARDETAHATWVVIVAVVVCSTFLGVFDAFWLWMTTSLFAVPGTI